MLLGAGRDIELIELNKLFYDLEKLLPYLHEMLEIMRIIVVHTRKLTAEQRKEAAATINPKLFYAVKDIVRISEGKKKDKDEE